MRFHNVYRSALLGLAELPLVEGTLRRRGMRLGVSRFVAGETLAEAVAAASVLEADGLRVILDLLGEFVEDEATAQAMSADVVRAIRETSSRLASPAISVKPTQIGLGLGVEVAFRNAVVIAEAAQESGTRITLDMENHPFVDGTLDLYRRLRRQGFEQVSTVIQSYLRRTPRDLEDLLELDPPPSLRIVKGAYLESAEVAYQDKAKVDEQYLELLFRLLEAGGEAHIATHDDRIISEAEGFLRGRRVAADRYEMQLLYGVRPALQRALRDRGHPVRIYVPFGRDWYGYFSRRLAERPANLMFVLRGLLG